MVYNAINGLKVYAYMNVCIYGSEYMYVCILVTGIYKLETATGIGIWTAL